MLEERGYISFAGGGIGIAALILSALNVAFMNPWREAKDPRFETAQKSFNFDRVMKFLERSLGGMSCHTDDRAIDDPLACKGCGHAMAFLSGGYGLGETYRRHMQEYMVDLKKRAIAGDESIIVDVYHGVHAETAVLRILGNNPTGEFVSIAPNDGLESVFVFNEQMDLEVLDRMAGMMYEEMRSDFEAHGISKEEFLAQTNSLYFGHVRSSAFKLANNLPVFDIVHLGPGKIEVRKSSLRY